MPTAFLSNFDFECRIGPVRFDLPEPVRRRRDLLAALWILVAVDGDSVVIPGGHRPKFSGDFECVPELRWLDSVPENVRVVPWGVDPNAAGVPPGAAPPTEAVRAVSDRAFAAADVELAQGLPRVEHLTEADEAFRLLEAAKTPRLMKASFSAFGRGCRRFLPGENPQGLEGWVRRQIRRGGLVVEPLLEMIHEWAGHWTIRPNGDIEFDGWTGLTADSSFQCATVESTTGVFGWPRGVDRSHREVADSAQRTLCERAAGLGYFGPLSFDAAVCKGPTGPFVRPCQDVNPRWTVGRLVLEGARRDNQNVRVKLPQSGSDELRMTIGDAEVIASVTY